MSQAIPLVILLNGPLGIGKSTLGEALGEALERSVTLDGDGLAALNPPPPDEARALHETLALLVAHHLARGYDRFVVNHYWSSPAQLADLRARLEAVAPRMRLHCYRLTLSREENLRRIASRRAARALDEAAFEAHTFAGEYAILSAAEGVALGVPFDVTDPPEVLVRRLMAVLGFPEPTVAAAAD